MKKIIFVFVIMVAILVGISLFIASIIVDEAEERVEDMESYVGRYIVIPPDTLMITDYSMMGFSYELENELTISKALVEKLLLPEDDKTEN